MPQKERDAIAVGPSMASINTYSNTVTEQASGGKKERRKEGRHSQEGGFGTSQGRRGKIRAGGEKREKREKRGVSFFLSCFVHIERSRV